MSLNVEVPLAWTEDATVADLLIIDGLDERTRCAVERYVRSERIENEDDYAQGFEDGCEAMKEEIDMCPIPLAPRRRRA